MIYCVEDDGSIRDLMIYTLNSAGFEAKGFDCGNSLFDTLQTEKPELILLDIMLFKRAFLKKAKGLPYHNSSVTDSHSFA